MSSHNICFYGETTKIIPKPQIPSLAVSLTCYTSKQLTQDCPGEWFSDGHVTDKHCRCRTTYLNFWLRSGSTNSRALRMLGTRICTPARSHRSRSQELNRMLDKTKPLIVWNMDYFSIPLNNWMQHTNTYMNTFNIESTQGENNQHPYGLIWYHLYIFSIFSS